MKGRIQNRTTTISHPIYGHVEWINTNDAGTEILIRRYCAKHGEHLTEWVEHPRFIDSKWVDYPLPTKKES